MKARLIRFVFALHRWMGVLLAVLMLVWCLSGFVMIFSPYPATSRDGVDLRRDGLLPIALPQAAVLPALDALPGKAVVVSARIEMMAADSVLRLSWRGGGGPGGRGAFDLATGAKIETIDQQKALDIAAAYAARHGLAAKPAIKKSSDRDEFTVAGNFNPQRPFWQVRLNDPARTMLYVSSKTGEIAQITTGSQRVLAWLGAIPHWLYFTVLRKDAQLWTEVVVWASLAGAFLTLLGLFVGIRQLRRRHSTGKLASPYRGVKTWHHWLGLSFGVLALTWVFSGFTSMQPWGWLETGQAASEAAERYSQGDRSWPETRAALAAEIDALRQTRRDVIELGSASSDDTLYFIRIDADGSRTRLSPDGRLAPFDPAARMRAGVILAEGHGSAKVELMTKEDAFYYKGAAASRLPVVRIAVPGMNGTRFYLDAVSGAVLATADPGDRGFRWWHLALHRLDFAFLRVGPLRQIVEIVLLAGVSALCGVGAWLALWKLMRGGKLDGRPNP